MTADPIVTDEAVWPAGPARHGQLVWAARAEHSRLHRLAVAAAHHQALVHLRLQQADQRIYRCPGCGDWRYHEARHYPGSADRCRACGTRRPAKEAAA